MGCKLVNLTSIVYKYSNNLLILDRSLMFNTLLNKQWQTSNTI